MGLQYNEKCDVFSFGIIMYEVVTQNFAPYGVQFGVELKVAKDPSFRPNTSMFSSSEHEWQQEMGLLMQYCWSHDPEERPSFNSLFSNITRIMEMQN